MIVRENRVQEILMDLRSRKISREDNFLITYTMLRDFVNMRRMKAPARYIQDSACGIGHGHLSFPVRHNVKIISREIFEMIQTSIKEAYPEETEVIAWPEQQCRSCAICVDKVKFTNNYCLLSILYIIVKCLDHEVK